MILPPPLSTAAVVVVAAQFHLNTHTKAREKVGQAEKEKKIRDSVEQGIFSGRNFVVKGQKNRKLETNLNLNHRLA